MYTVATLSREHPETLMQIPLYSASDIQFNIKFLFISTRMPVQAPSWTEFLICPICTNEFEAVLRAPITLRCGHTICKKCLANVQQCPYDQVSQMKLNPRK